MKNLKRRCFLILVLFPLLACCNSQAKKEEEHRDPSEIEYGPVDDNFYVGAYCEPYLFTEEVYQDVKDCGITHIYIDPWFNGTNINNESKICDALELCETAGIKALVMINNTHENVQKEERLISFSEYQTDFSQYPAFDGFYAFDEPFSSQFDWIKEDYAKWEQTYPEYMYFVNMMLGDNVIQSKDQFFKKYCDEILSKFNGRSKLLSIDHYPLNHYRRGEVEYDYINHTCLESLERASYFAHEYNAPFYWFLQTIGDTEDATRRPETMEEIRWQAAIALCYGAKGFECFTYSSMAFEGWKDAMVTGGGVKTNLYYYVQQLNQELAKFKDTYFSFDYKGTMINDTDATSYNADDFSSLTHVVKSHERIKSLTTKRDCLIGTFKDKDGNDGFMFTTYNDPHYRKYNQIQVSFNNASKAILYRNGERSVVDLENGTLNYELSSSDFLFVIPV